MLITPLRAEHVDAVAALHGTTLTGLLASLGPPATRAFYAGCVSHPLAIALVAVDQERVRGFVLGSLDAPKLRREVVRQRPFSTALAIVRGVLHQPATLAWLAGSTRERGDGLDRSGPELTYLAVQPDQRKGGIGRQLVSTFSTAIGTAGAPAYEVSVDADNAGAIAFYESLGFALVGSYHEFDRPHRRYRIELG